MSENKNSNKSGVIGVVLVFAAIIVIYLVMLLITYMKNS